MTLSANGEHWVFTSASSVVSALGVRAELADSWKGLISTDVQLASRGSGVVVGVTPRSAYPPLIHIAQSSTGQADDYNPRGLSQAAIFILVPQAMMLAAANEAKRLVEDEKRLANEAARWEAGREAREKLATELMAPVKTKAEKYRLSQLDLFGPDLSPNWLFAALLKDSSPTGLSQDELIQVKQSGHLYFAAAAYWHAWEAHDNPWDAVQSCSLLRITNDHIKALKLSAKLPTDTWNGKVRSALLTTRGGALRDLGQLEESWSCAQDALKSHQDGPHTFMLLGALCYQTDRYAEGDGYFQSARERGATDRQIEGMRADADRRKRPAPLPFKSPEAFEGL